MTGAADLAALLASCLDQGRLGAKGAETQTGFRVKGLGFRFKGLGLRD